MVSLSRGVVESSKTIGRINVLVKQYTNGILFVIEEILSHKTNHELGPEWS